MILNLCPVTAELTSKDELMRLQQHMQELNGGECMKSNANNTRNLQMENAQQNSNARMQQHFSEVKEQ